MVNEETKDKDSNVKDKIRGHLDSRRRGEGAAGLYSFLLFTEKMSKSYITNRITALKSPFLELPFL